MKRILSIFSITVLLLSACNNAPKTVEDKEKAPVSTPTPPADNKPAFQPYKSRLIQLTLKDFDKWYTAFKTDTLMKGYGLSDPGVGRITGNDKKVIIFANVADVAKAKQYDGSKERAEHLLKGGVTAGMPSYWTVVMDDTTHIAPMERALLTFHVKDFAAWKKSFDAEGIETRKANGFYERAIAQGIDDPTMVGLLIAITDKAKMTARVNSPELKKIMDDAGVVSKPEPVFFTWVDNN